MNQIRKLTMPIISEVEKILNRGLDNVYLNTALKVFLVLYAALAAPQFPPKLVFLMDNIFVKIGISFLIVFMALRDPGLALIIAVAFVITLQTANKLRLINTDLSQALPGETSWLPSTKEHFETDGAAADTSGSGDADATAAAVDAAAVDAVAVAAAVDDAGDATSNTGPTEVAAAAAVVAAECAACQQLIDNDTCRVNISN